MIELGAALMIGLLGSLHCVGMCGPLALALPRSAGARWSMLGGRVAYNLGRAITYAALGTVFGLAGQTLLLAGWQRALSILAGLVILAYLAARTWGGGRLGRSGWTPEVALTRLIAPVQRHLGRLLHRPGAGSLLLIGLLNGLLPCGLVYVALAGATATGSAAGGAAFMAVFGLGTLPLMLAVSLAGPTLHGVLRGRFQRAIPIALSVLAVLFILRGLSLGIPYVSPDLSRPGAHACCAP